MDVANVYTELRHSLLSYINSKVSNKEDAEDILQNVFVKVATNVNTLSEKENVQNWVFTVTRNTIIDYYRTRANQQTASLEADLAAIIPDDSDFNATKGLEQCIQGMIGMLPDDYRTIMIDAELNGIRQKDLAEKYEMAYPSLRSRVQRGRDRLKNMLYDCCRIELDPRGNILEAGLKNTDQGHCKPSED